MLHLNSIKNGKIKDKKISYLDNSLKTYVKTRKKQDNAYDHISYWAKIFVISIRRFTMRLRSLLRCRICLKPVTCNKKRSSAL